MIDVKSNWIDFLRSLDGLTYREWISLREKGFLCVWLQQKRGKATQQWLAKKKYIVQKQLEIMKKTHIKDSPALYYKYLDNLAQKKQKKLMDNLPKCKPDCPLVEFLNFDDLS